MIPNADMRGVEFGDNGFERLSYNYVTLVAEAKSDKFSHTVAVFIRDEGKVLVLVDSAIR